MRDYLQRLLAAASAVEAVPDGQAALEAARREAPDLILADVMMPKLDGLGMLKELRADPNLKTVPVILLTARAGDEAKLEGLNAGADDYLTKPFSARELSARVSSNLKLSRHSPRADEARRDAEQQFQVLADNIPALCWMARADGWIYWYNRHWYEYTGTTPESQEGWGWEVRP